MLNPDIICIVESWLSPNNINGSLKLDNYNIFETKQGLKMEGVLIAIKKSLIASPISYIGKNEILCVDIFEKNEKLLRIINVYNFSLQNISTLKSILFALEI